MEKTISRFLILFIALFVFVGCGSGSTVSLPQNRTGKLLFSASNSTLSAPVTSIQVKAKLPDGVTVPLKARLPGDTGAEEIIDPGSLKALVVSGFVTGTYLAASREIALTITPQLPALNFGVGTIGAFAEVTVTSASSVTKEIILNSNPDLAAGLVVRGFDSINGSTVILTGIIPSLDVTF